MKDKQGITIAALIIAIVGLSIGFAAFSNTLTISSSATVTPSDENFIVQFSKVSGADQTGSEYPIVPNSETYGDNAIINSSNKKLLEGVHAKFTAPGQSVTYTLYVRNTGAYVAYLKELAFANATNATGSETYKHCYAATTDSNSQPISSENQATPSLVTQACNGIDISVTIGTASNITPSSASKSLGNQALSANGGYVQATITITYANNASYVDGPMEVEFGNISFTATSNSGTSQQEQSGQEEPQQTVDALIPTEEEKSSAYFGGNTYQFIGSKLMYSDAVNNKFVQLEYNDVTYMWFCDSATAEYYGGMMSTTLQPYIWYVNGEVYSNSSPISLSDFNSDEIKSESYVTRVINSFSNNG